MVNDRLGHVVVLEEKVAVNRNRIVFWLGEPSPHQSSVLCGLADVACDRRIITIFQRRLSNDRLAQGWHVPHPGRTRVVMAPDGPSIAQIARQEPEASVHVFGGMRLPMIRRALRECSATNALLGVASEGRPGDGVLGVLRRSSTFVLERPYRKRTDFVLAIGKHAAQWYEMCGYSQDRIFDWGYFVEAPPRRALAPIQRSWVAITFVGQLIRRKGLDTLIRALSRLNSRHWKLEIVGDGSERRSLQKLAFEFGIGDRVCFIGPMSNSQVREVLAHSDLLVLPSRFDGWGAVVNEALMEGIPAICSDMCGAAVLLRSRVLGAIYRAGSVDELAAVLASTIERGPLPLAQRRENQTWSRCISGGAAARYLLEIIEHVSGGAGERPLAPWQCEHVLGRNMRSLRDTGARALQTIANSQRCVE